MLELANQTANKIIVNVAFPPIKYNRMWGSDYMLMDSNTFMGGIGGDGYDNVINLYTNLWNSYQYQLFCNLQL